MIAKRRFLMLGVLALGLGFAFVAYNSAFSQAVPPVTRGPYMIAGGDKMIVWRVDQATGKVSYCMRDTVSMDPKFIATRATYCSAWSNN